MYKMLRLPVTVLVLIGLGEFLFAGRLNETVLVLPQVARGAMIETEIVFLNTAATTTEVAVVVTDARLLNPAADFGPGYADFQLAPFERREIRIERGEDLIIGAVEIRAEHSLSVEARILTLEVLHGDIADIASQVTVLAQPPHTELVIPISYKADGIDNTGVALYCYSPGILKSRLYNAAGTLVSENQIAIGGFLGSPPRHSARFIDEMFSPSILGENFTGLLRVEFSAMGLAAAALYTHGSALWTAQVQEVREAKGHYSMKLKSGIDVNSVGQLQAQYGFKVIATDWGPSWVIESTEEVARALDRDSRIESVFAKASVPQ
jgi:hypothetical protein